MRVCRETLFFLSSSFFAPIPTHERAMDARTLFDGINKTSRGDIDDDELLVRMIERGMAV